MQTPSKEAISPALEAIFDTGALAGKWVLDPRNSSVRLRSNVLWGLIPVTGIFREVSGSGTVSSDGDVTGTLTVAAASIDTTSTRRDKHLRSADFFDCAAYPFITFSVDGVRAHGQGVVMSGALRVRDRTRTVSFDASVVVKSGDNIQTDAQVDINRADFGMTCNRMHAVSLNNSITIRAAFSKRPPVVPDHLV